MPRAEFLAKIICWQCRAASCCKQQIFRQERTSLVFMGVLDQPLAFGYLSCMLSISLPRWRSTDCALYHACTWRASLGSIWRLSGGRVDDPRRCGRQQRTGKPLAQFQQARQSVRMALLHKALVLPAKCCGLAACHGQHY